jgi:hypothetical protein
MALALVAGVPTAPAATFTDGDVYARVTAHRVVLGNGVAERRWSRPRLRTVVLTDKRRGGRDWSHGRTPDFELNVAGARIPSGAFRITKVGVTRLARGGLRVTMRLAGPPGLRATRTAEAYPGIAGFRTQTVLRPAIPLALSGVTLEKAAVGPATAPTIHAFRAGSDWREPGYTGPPVGVGDQHPGDWRDSRAGPPGQPLAAPGEWVSIAGGPRSLFMAAEENDFPSSRGEYDAHGRAALKLDYASDVISLGPLEESGHVENPAPGPAGRQRLVAPGATLALPPVFTGFGDHDGDEPWQFHRYLTEHRLAPFPHAVVFNSDGTDSNRISTGAKDDMDFATVQQVAPIARRLGVETFVLDDGWQAASGDWQPDSPQHPEPRGLYPPRFPDATFTAVRAAIAPMQLGLWMSPVHFNPASETYRQHPEWGCTPTGQGTAIANLAQPDDGSNEAGIGQWSPAAFPHVESRIRDAIENWGVRYFKFDFMVWLDCAGAGDLHDYHDAFLAMLDRLQRDHPEVTFQTDETNDYRLFPFESTARGPTWFQNGKPDPALLLHNLWQLSPYVPTAALGQHVLGGDAWKRHPVDTLMAAALPSHMTLISDIRQLPDDVVARAADWIGFYKAHRENFTQLVYPLLADPIANGWTALQSWNPDTGSGALLAFRQDSDETAQTIRLRNVPPGRRFRLVNAPDGTSAGTATSKRLQKGLRIELPEKDSARVLVIEPA